MKKGEFRLAFFVFLDFDLTEVTGSNLAQRSEAISRPEGVFLSPLQIKKGEFRLAFFVLGMT